MNILKIENLFVETKFPKKKILDNISFNIKSKEIFALIGSNGSGKSTLAYALMGLSRYKITSGKIIFNNKNITKLSVNKRAKLGLTLAFQEPAYFDGITVENFLKIGNKYVKQNEIEKVLSLVGLEPKKFLNREINRQLSGGERKRLEIASVIILKPKLMILDEPDSGLDIIIYKELYDILDNIRQVSGASILLITHREEIGALADRAALIDKGRLVYNGNFRKVMTKYCQLVGRRKRCQKLKRLKY